MDPYHWLRFPFKHVIAVNKTLFLEYLDDRKLHFGGGHQHTLVACHDGIAYPGQHISDGVNNCHSSLPARLSYPGNYTNQSTFPEANTTQSEFAHISTRPTT